MKINNNLKSKFIFLTLLCISCLSLNVKAEAADLKVRVLVDNANIRLRADSTTQVVSNVPIGIILESEGIFGEWYRVKLPPNKEGFVVTGYIHQKLVIEILGETKEIKEIPKIEKEKPAEPLRPVQKPAVTRGMTSQHKFYLKGILGFGIGFEKISSGAYKIYEDDREPEEINIYPGGGINIDGIFGYKIIPALNVELGIGYQSSGSSIKDDEVSFHRAILSLSLIHEFESKSSIHFYIGGGSGIYFSPNYKLEIGNLRAEIKYDPSFGLHGLAGIAKRTKGKNLFYFGEIRFVGLINYKWNEATFVNYSFIPTSKFHELSGNGIFINVGIGYYF